MMKREKERRERTRPENEMREKSSESEIKVNSKQREKTMPVAGDNLWKAKLVALNLRYPQNRETESFVGQGNLTFYNENNA